MKNNYFGRERHIVFKKPEALGSISGSDLKSLKLIPEALSDLTEALQLTPDKRGELSPQIKEIIDLVDKKKQLLKQLEILDDIKTRLAEVLPLLEGNQDNQKEAELYLTENERKIFFLEFASIFPPFRVSKEFKQQWCESGLIQKREIPGMLPFIVSELLAEELGRNLTDKERKLFKTKIPEYIAQKNKKGMGQLARFLLQKFNMKDADIFFDQTDVYIEEHLGRTLTNNEKKLFLAFVRDFSRLSNTGRGIESVFDTMFQEVITEQKRRGGDFGSADLFHFLNDGKWETASSEEFFLLRLLNEGVVDSAVIANTVAFRLREGGVRKENYNILFERIKFEVSGLVDIIELELGKKEILAEDMQDYLYDFFDQCGSYQRVVRIMQNGRTQSEFIDQQYSRLDGVLGEFLLENSYKGYNDLRRVCGDFRDNLKHNEAHSQVLQKGNKLAA